MNEEQAVILACSFCGKSQREVRKLIAGPTVYICDECIGLCNDIIAEEIDREGDLREFLLTAAQRYRRVVDGLLDLDQPTVAGLPRSLQDAMENVRAASKRLETAVAACVPQIPAASPRTTRSAEGERERTRTAGLSAVLDSLVVSLHVLKRQREQLSATLSTEQAQALDEVTRTLSELGDVVRRHLTDAFGMDPPRD